MGKITAEQCVRTLKDTGISLKAYELALILEVDSRAVATALRTPTRDGRVKVTHARNVAFYDFISLTPKATP